MSDNEKQKRKDRIDKIVAANLSTRPDITSPTDNSEKSSMPVQALKPAGSTAHKRSRSTNKVESHNLDQSGRKRAKSTNTIESPTPDQSERKRAKSTNNVETHTPEQSGTNRAKSTNKVGSQTSLKFHRQSKGDEMSTPNSTSKKRKEKERTVKDQ